MPQPSLTVAIQGQSLYSSLARLSISVLLTVYTAIAYAQPVATEEGAATEAKPFIIERRQIGDGPKTDPWLRFELWFGERAEKCRPWRVEMQGQRDGHAVFDVKEPVDKSVILDSQFSPQHLEVVLGDADCNYRIRIERNK